VDHFNAKNSIIVPELKDFSACSVKFGDLKVLDTGTNSHQAMETIIEDLQISGPVDAIAGPYNEIPALELSVLATGMKAPIVSHRASDYNLLLPEKHPYFSQVSADLLSEMAFVDSYLSHIGRINYVAVVYSSSATAIQKVDMLRALLDNDGFNQVQTFSYQKSSDMVLADGLEGMPDRTIYSALEKVRKTGYRTIVLITSQLFTDSPEIGAAAKELGLDQGEHMWILSGGAEEYSSREQFEFLTNSLNNNDTDFLKGSAYLLPSDGFDENMTSDIQIALIMQDITFLQRLRDLNPIPNYIDWEQLALQVVEHPFAALMTGMGSWWSGTSYMYDAVMSIGLGACKATADASNTAMTGEMHLAGIRSVNFHGPSGNVRFHNSSTYPGSRAWGTVPFAVVNVLPLGAEG
jgi:hypothetical protein